MGTPSLLVALDYLELLAEVKPEKLEPAAVRWHGRLEVEAAAMTLAESQLALAALASLCAGERDAVDGPAPGTTDASRVRGGSPVTAAKARKRMIYRYVLHLGPATGGARSVGRSRTRSSRARPSRSRRLAAGRSAVS